MFNIPNIMTAIAIWNIWTFMLFGYDKLCAKKRRWRVSEASLLFAAFLGGTPGAYAGRRIFRHKSRKQPFSSRLRLIAIFQAIILTMAAGWMLAG